MHTKHLVELMRRDGLTTKQNLKLNEIITSNSGYQLDDKITTFFAQWMLEMPVPEDKSTYNDKRSKLWI